MGVFYTDEMSPTDYIQTDPSNGIESRVVASKISAGFPSPATDHVDSTQLDLNTYLVANKASSFYFTVEGESMLDAGIHSGDHVLVDRSITARTGDIVVAEIDGEHTIKTLYVGSKKIELRPANKTFKPVEIKESNQLVIWGVVTAVIRKIRR
jgi:DNA polymerase V